MAGEYVRVMRGMAEVYKAGAKCARSWSLNVNRQQEAEILETMAKRAEELAEEAETT